MDREAASRTVLYVEDEESDTLFMRRAFAIVGSGLGLQLVGDGRAAIKYLSGVNGYENREKYPVPVVVLLDLNLPDVHGFEVLRWMRTRPEYARTPVMIFSSSTKEEDRVKARELGANEFVEKPTSGLKFEAVVARLREQWLGEKSRTESGT
jgi:DNA-binding response OmpR family regulator